MITKDNRTSGAMGDPSLDPGGGGASGGRGANATDDGELRKQSLPEEQVPVLEVSTAQPRESIQPSNSQLPPPAVPPVASVASSYPRSAASAAGLEISTSTAVAVAAAADLDSSCEAMGASGGAHELSPVKGDASTSCWPLLFERAAPTWWHPQFDSPILEQQYWQSTLPRTTRRFQFGLVYLLLVALALCIYFPVMGTPHWPVFLGLGCAILLVVVMVLGLTAFLPSLYQQHCFKISLVLSVVLCTLSLMATANLSLPGDAVDITPAGLFAIYVAILLLFYTAVPLPLYGTLIIGAAYTCLFEILLCVAWRSRTQNAATVIVNILMHCCLHIVGIHILITTQVRMRDTFMKVGQSLMVKKQLVTEKGLKEKMIHSVMPPKVADWLMTEGHAEDLDDFPGGPPGIGNKGAKANGPDKLGKGGGGSKKQKKNQGGYGYDSDSSDVGDSYSDYYEAAGMGTSLRKISSPRSSNQGDIRTIPFRPFNMNAMDDVRYALLLSYSTLLHLSFICAIDAYADLDAILAGPVPVIDARTMWDMATMRK